MQIGRLFEMVYLLLERENITAKELAQRFEVSERTVYRDVDALSAAGIPVYTAKGKGGGIRLLPDFILNKSVLSSQEQDNILYGLQSLSAARYPEAGAVLGKLRTFFLQGGSWLDRRGFHKLGKRAGGQRPVRPAAHRHFVPAAGDL